MNRKALASLVVFVVTLATAAGALAQTPSMQDALKKKTPAYALGPIVAASITRMMTSRGTGSDFSRRIARVV